jgi:hypothetical protein
LGDTLVASNAGPDATEVARGALAAKQEWHSALATAGVWNEVQRVLRIEMERQTMQHATGLAVFAEAINSGVMTQLAMNPYYNPPSSKAMVQLLGGGVPEFAVTRVWHGFKQYGASVHPGILARFKEVVVDLNKIRMDAENAGESLATIVERSEAYARRILPDKLGTPANVDAIMTESLRDPARAGASGGVSGGGAASGLARPTLSDV